MVQPFGHLLSNGIVPFHFHKDWITVICLSFRKKVGFGDYTLRFPFPESNGLEQDERCPMSSHYICICSCTYGHIHLNTHTHRPTYKLGATPTLLSPPLNPLSIKTKFTYLLLKCCNPSCCTSTLDVIW